MCLFIVENEDCLPSYLSTKLYRGNISVSVDNIACNSWAEDVSGVLDYLEETGSPDFERIRSSLDGASIADGSFEEAGNKCR